MGTARGVWAGVGVVLLVEGLGVMGVHLAGWLPPPVLVEKISIWFVVNEQNALHKPPSRLVFKGQVQSLR